MNLKLILSVLCVYFVSLCLGQNSNETTTPSPSISSTENNPTTTAASTVEERCMSRNGSCGDCVAHAECLWCSSKVPSCIPYPTGDVIPGSDTCSLSDARWGVCWVNYEILLICMGVLGGVILITLCCCVYCCCCRTNKAKQKRKYDREDAKIEREREEREMKHNERKADRKKKHDEIRKKYGLNRTGLIKDDNPYQRFDE